MSTSVPATPEEFLASPLSQVPWYYSVEVFPGLVARGSFPDDLVMLPRLLTRHAEVTGHSCLDIGSMEGLLPTLLARRGASRVVATDAVPHCVARMDAIKQYYDVEFEFSAVGLLYDLDKKLSPQCFDFINLPRLSLRVEIRPSDLDISGRLPHAGGRHRIRGHRSTGRHAIAWAHCVSGRRHRQLRYARRPNKYREGGGRAAGRPVQRPLISVLLVFHRRIGGPPLHSARSQR